MLFPLRKFHLILLCSLLAVGFSCRKAEKISTDPSMTLSFSTDTVFFDTVFPTVGSITQRLVVYNRNSSGLTISSIRLAGGAASSYRININGSPVLTASGVDLVGNDSMYIFVRVTVDPHNESTPYVVSDSIEFITNGNLQRVRLVAWGREAIFYRQANLQGNITWDSLRAHVIYDSLRIDTGSTLLIQSGTKVYFHQGAHMSVSKLATLKVTGTLEHPVRIQGDRLDPYYKDLPGQWEGIYLEKGSFGHEFDYAYIKNGTFGLAVDSLGASGEDMLKIRDCMIQNMTAYGIYANGTTVSSVNCVIGDCGRSCFAAFWGGSYDFRQLTIGNYWWASVRHAPALYLSNYGYSSTGNKVYNPLTKANFSNVIIYGSNEEEVELDADPASQFEYYFDHAILKTKLNTTNTAHYSDIKTDDPVFVNPSELNYQIDSISPAIGAGKDLGIPFDIRGHNRPVTPALGAYEYVKEK
jgi:hypothetical protein